MKLSRRAWLLGLPLGACATGGWVSGDRIVDTATGKPLDELAVVNRIRSVDVLLLGELHDNPHHHQRRARLLVAMDEPVPVVAEHLPMGAAPVLPRNATSEALRQVLVAAGFDASGWRWPVHEPLFAAIAREGPTALPPDLKTIIEGAPLPNRARQALEQALMQGHCGNLPADRLPGMVWAQRGRDAAMAAALMAELEALRAERRAGPVVLLAGNGHVRREYGVPRLLARISPSRRWLTIGFVEAESEAGPSRTFYDIVWTTTTANRVDPCAAFDSSRRADGGWWFQTFPRSVNVRAARMARCATPNDAITVTPGVFCHPLHVGAQSIDFNQHVNNVQFVQWLQDVAMLHSAACGWPLERYQRMGTSWVVRSHFIEYLRPARLDDALLLATWIAGFAGDSSPRRTLVWRPRDRKLLARAETVWVFVDAASGRGLAVPSDFVAAFDNHQDERTALRALRGWVAV